MIRYAARYFQSIPAVFIGLLVTIIPVVLLGSPRDVANKPVKRVAAPKVVVSAPMVPAGISPRTNFVTLAWNASTSTVAGYRLYQSTNLTWNASVDVGNVLSYQWTVPSRSVTNYFAATAYDSNGTESDYSTPAILPPPVSPTVYRLFYLQTSADMVTWTDIPATPMLRITNSLVQFGQEFYRWRVTETTNIIQ